MCGCLCTCVYVNVYLSLSLYTYIDRYRYRYMLWASQLELVLKNPPANLGDIRDAGMTPELGSSPREWHGNTF